MGIPTLQEIKEAARNAYWFTGNQKYLSCREGFEKGAEWMEAQLEPMITELAMEKVRSTKWIDVKDSLPTEGNRYWCYIQELNDGGWFSYFQWNCYYDPQEKVFRDAGKTHKVTHWTNLLPPPL